MSCHMEFVLADILVKIILFIIMLGVGSTISLADFKKVFILPKQLFTGLALQIIGLPLIALIVAEFSGLADPVKAGLVILAACPGGTTSNFISFLANAKTSLSIALTSVNSIIILATIPFLSRFAINYFMDVDASVFVPVFDMIFTIFFIVILPAIFGMLVRKLKPYLADRLKRPIKYTSIILIVILFLFKYFGDTSLGGSSITPSIVINIMPVLLLFHIISLSVGFFSGILLNFEKEASITLGIEVGLQNTTLALLVTSAVINNDVISYPALVYALFSFVTTLFFALGMKALFRKVGHPFDNGQDT